MNRNKEYGITDDSKYNLSDEVKLSVYKKMMISRAMEERMIEAKNNGRIPSSLYLSSGQEAVAAALSECVKEYQIFAQHRSGDIYMSFGGSLEALRDELLGKESGCSSGKGGHVGIQCHNCDMHMFGDNLLIGQCVPRGVGAALGNNKKTLCVFGDGAGEEDYVLESLGFAATHSLPVLFVCMDNDLAILTKVEERRSWSLVDIAKSFGLPAFDLTDDPWSIIDLIQSGEFRLPCFINVHVCREYWHVGTGTDGPREWEREKIVREQLIEAGYKDKVEEIERQIEKRMEEVWGNDFV